MASEAGCEGRPIRVKGVADNANSEAIFCKDFNGNVSGANGLYLFIDPPVDTHPDLSFESTEFGIYRAKLYTMDAAEEVKTYDTRLFEDFTNLNVLQGTKVRTENITKSGFYPIDAKISDDDEYICFKTEVINSDGPAIEFDIMILENRVYDSTLLPSANSIPLWLTWKT